MSPDPHLNDPQVQNFVISSLMKLIGALIFFVTWLWGILTKRVLFDTPKAMAQIVKDNHEMQKELVEKLNKKADRRDVFQKIDDESTTLHQRVTKVEDRLTNHNENKHGCKGEK